MRAALKIDLKSKTICVGKRYACLRKTEESLIDFKFYQKLTVVLITLSTILIFPETPRKLENICENYNSKKACIVL